MLYTVQSKRNKPMLLLDTFRYTQDKISNTTTYCKCENRSCCGRALQYVSNPPSMKKPDDHDSDEMKCKVKEFRTNLKQRIEDSAQPVKRIYREQLISLCFTYDTKIKNPLYQTRNTSCPPAPCMVTLKERGVKL